ncbi:hypothetical protein HJFPF1_07697 [Paramyrothecium foliicola]|nr:hypothetical protein HJFPF1_07692 [Paramyrothecium foliicola]KAI9155123.1 hypothetical protein HJFPF1_07697 [Paramyrothecium foliicola]
MPKGGWRLVLRSPKDGLCGWLADGKHYTRAAGDSPRAADAEWEKLRGRVLLLGPLGHTAHSVERCGRRVLWGT